MEYKYKLHLQKCIYFNSCVFVVWVITAAFFFNIEKHSCDHLLKYLSITLFFMFTIIECIRLYLGQTGNLLSGVPELASFLMLSIFMQLPLMTYFLFNPNLMKTPTEVTLHIAMWVIMLLEVVLSCQALKRASSIAKSVYFCSRM